MAKGSTAFLMYHELGLPGRALCHSEPGYARYVVPASDFRNQMERLSREGWRGRNVTEALEFSGEKSVCITFDDGCETDLISAAPTLNELGFGATSYITVKFLGKPGYMSQAQVRELHALGFEIGCHSLTHSYLTAIVMTALVGALLGFLYHNFNPARIFMGDGGSYLLGYVFSVTVLSGSTQKASAVATSASRRMRATSGLPMLVM